MVLWEITLGTAYFLGLKRTYRLALKIQRRLISPKHPKIRQFAQRRTRAAFDMALTVHRNIQRRDLEVGRNLGNWILRWLDKMKPSAEIRGPREGNFTPKRNLNSKTRKQHSDIQGRTPGGSQKFSTLIDRDSGRRHFPLSKLSDIRMMTRPTNGSNIQHRRLSFMGSTEFRQDTNYSRAGYSGVVRKDIIEWMSRK